MAIVIGMDLIKRRPPLRRRRWRSKNGLMVPTGEAVAEALQAIPTGMPWAWAALRVLPTVRGGLADLPDDWPCPAPFA